MFLTQIKALEHRLQYPLPGTEAQERMSGRRIQTPSQAAPGNARESAVLLLLFEQKGESAILLTQRVENKSVHSGQISFPGGKRDPEDISLEQTALRETWEEVGIDTRPIQIIGKLSPLYIPVSNFLVNPFVAFLEKAPHRFILSEHEVASVIISPLDTLFHTENKAQRRIRPASHPSMIFDVPVYNLPDDKFIWGATAMILSELEAIWKAIPSD